MEKKKAEQARAKRFAARFLVILLICTLMDAAVLGAISEVKRSEKRQQAYSYGETVANAIQSSLENSLSATQTMKYFYLQYGEDFFEDFPEIAQNIMADEPLIASIYVAPEGVIQAAYPDNIANSTIGFEMLKDPEQGPRAKLAVDTGRITVAGPHELVEGGVGFIIRNPIYENGKFSAFTIIVLDWDRFVEQMLSSVEYLSGEFRFAVWKDNVDETAVTDAEGYIFRSDVGEVDHSVELSFDVPNDTWHLAVTPVNGWSVWRDMIWEILAGTGFSVAILIISHFVFYSRERKKTLAQEISANKAKSAFLFNMSHEIRTPMNAIMGYTELIEKHLDDKEKLQDYVDKIHMASDFLLSLINNTLEMARIESGKTVLNEETTNIEEFVEGVIAVFQGLIDKKKLKFVSKVKVEHPWVMADATKLREIFLNILGNSVKYTPAGGEISLAVTEVSTAEPGKVRYRIEFDDNGIGMSKDFVPRIFDEFSREKSSTESKVAGTGLGMPIVKKLVELMKGSIQVESAPGKGTTFILLLELRSAEEPANEKACEERRTYSGLQGRRVLLAEDNDLNAEIARAILEEEGVLVERAVDGIDCINQLNRAEAGYFDMILMDIQMPHMDGYQATKQIRGAKGDKAQIPIVAMTANAFEEDRKAALEAGMNEHIAKPIISRTLFETMERILKQSV